MPGAARAIGAVTVFDQASAAVRSFAPGPISRVLQVRWAPSLSES